MEEKWKVNPGWRWVEVTLICGGYVEYIELPWVWYRSDKKTVERAKEICRKAMARKLARESLRETI